MGAFLSQTDKNDLLRNVALQALTLQGTPPLSLVANFHSKPLSDVVFYSTATGFAAVNIAGDLLEIKCYVANVDERCEAGK